MTRQRHFGGSRSTLSCLALNEEFVNLTWLCEIFGNNVTVSTAERFTWSLQHF